MRNNSDWRMRHNERIKNHFYPDNYYAPTQYPTIVPYCALPNYWSMMNYEIEDLIDKKYKTEINKMLLMRDGYYPKKLMGGNSYYQNKGPNFDDFLDPNIAYSNDYNVKKEDVKKTYDQAFKNYTPSIDPLLIKLKAVDTYFNDMEQRIAEYRREREIQEEKNRHKIVTSKVDQYFEDQAKLEKQEYNNKGNSSKEMTIESYTIPSEDRDRSKKLSMSNKSGLNTPSESIKNVGASIIHSGVKPVVTERSSYKEDIMICKVPKIKITNSSGYQSK